MDALIIVPVGEADWHLDVDVVEGELLLVPGDESNENIQNAAIAALFSVGTIPGREELGTDWGGYLAGQKSLVECDNEVKSNMEEFTNVSSLANSPIPLYEKDPAGGIRIQFLQLPELKHD